MNRRDAKISIPDPESSDVLYGVGLADHIKTTRQPERNQSPSIE